MQRRLRPRPRAHRRLRRQGRRAGRVRRSTTGDPGCFRDRLEDAAHRDPPTATCARPRRRWLSQGDHTLEVLPYPAPPRRGARATVDRSTGVPAIASSPASKFPAIAAAPPLERPAGDAGRAPGVPVVQMSLLFDAGYAADQGRKLGTASFTMAMLDEGTKALGALAIADRAESLGADLGDRLLARHVVRVGLRARRAASTPSLALSRRRRAQPGVPARARSSASARSGSPASPRRRRARTRSRAGCCRRCSTARAIRTPSRSPAPAPRPRSRR